jgi:hypothetical protein
MRQRHIFALHVCGWFKLCDSEILLHPNYRIMHLASRDSETTYRRIEENMETLPDTDQEAR